MRGGKKGTSGPEKGKEKAPGLLAGRDGEGCMIRLSAKGYTYPVYGGLLNKKVQLVLFQLNRDLICGQVYFFYLALKDPYVKVCIAYVGISSGYTPQCPLFVP